MDPIFFEGKYTSCNVFATSIEPAATQQVYAFLNSPAFEGSKISIMPDVHAGAGCVVGFTSTLTDKVIPNVVGVDIGCGVLCVRLWHGDPIDFAALDALIREHIPSGFSVNSRPQPVWDPIADQVRSICEKTGQDHARVAKSVGTLGGGNHFIELGLDRDSTPCLTVHTGSRNFGLQVANWHQRQAVQRHGNMGGLEWLEGAEAQSYLEDMACCQLYASMNRRRIAEIIVDGFFDCDLRQDRIVESVHNYIDFDDRIIRKGAISAKAGESVVIPWNMRDGLIIGRGKGNPDWNFSAPHGAGRVMGRGQAKRTLKLDDFQGEMVGIWTSCVGQDTLDESPMVYKPADEILAAIGDTVEIEHTVRPVYNFKASS